MKHIIFDLEATCWEKGSNIDRMEIIEIGAAKLVSEVYEVSDTFSTFVRPTREPILSDFCKNLTTISQSEVESAPIFPEALENFLNWIGEGETVMCSWGAYDIRQIKADCKKHDLEHPVIFDSHINLKETFSKLSDCRPCGMRKALNILGIGLQGTHHRGIDDALNISRIAQRILPLYYGGGTLEK